MGRLYFISISSLLDELSLDCKKYIDETFTQGIHYSSDGRSRSDESKTYGSGGLLKGKYMLSLTYNCPTSEFSNKAGFLMDYL